MYTGLKFENKEVTYTNVICTSIDVFNTFVPFWFKKPLENGERCLYVNPIHFEYGGEKFVSAMDTHFYTYNKTLLNCGLTCEQIKAINNEVQTLQIKSFHAGQRK